MTGDSSNPDAYHAKLVNSDCVAQSSQGHQGYPLAPNWIPPEENPKKPRNPALGNLFGTSREVKALGWRLIVPLGGASKPEICQHNPPPYSPNPDTSRATTTLLQNCKLQIAKLNLRVVDLQHPVYSL